MRAGDRIRAQRGYTILEVMIASVVLLIGLLGFAATSLTAMTGSRSANTRTSLTLVRGALVDRLTVTSRNAFGTIPTTWTIDDCYDANSILLTQNTAYSSTFSCPGGTAYRGWVRAQATGSTATWWLQLYVEATDPGCAPGARYASAACVGADLYLSD